MAMYRSATIVVATLHSVQFRLRHTDETVDPLDRSLKTFQLQLLTSMIAGFFFLVNEQR